MNDIAKQLRTNADFVLGGTGMPSGAAIAGALQMGADEIDRLTRELDEARKLYEVTHSALFGATQRIDELESRLAWHKVSEGLPTQVGVYVADNQVEEFDPADEQAVQWWRDNQQYNFWLGPLPAAPNEAGK